MYYMKVLSVPLLCKEGIVSIQVLCSIPLAWTWRYCQWYWQCLHIQTKGALITCINHCHLLELTLLCLVDLWKLDKSISSFKVPGAFIFILFLIEIHVPVCKGWKSWSYVEFLGVWSGPALFAYVHFYRTLCTSRPVIWIYCPWVGHEAIILPSWVGLAMSEKFFNLITVMSHYISKKKLSCKDKIKLYVLYP